MVLDDIRSINNVIIQIVATIVLAGLYTYGR